MAKGRPKKNFYIPRAESIVYAEESLQDYRELQLQCRTFEKMHETLFQKIDTDKLKEMLESGSCDKVPRGMNPIMENYLEKKERLLLVSNALDQMPEDIQTVTRMRCVDGSSIEEVMEKTGVSRATVKRKAKEGIRMLAEHVEVYMWCKAVKALGL